MYHILERSPERFGERPCQMQGVSPKWNEEDRKVLVLLMQQNRSSFPKEGREALSVMITLFMAMSILPALSGNYVVPIFSIGVMAMLVWALDRHQKSAPYSEHLELADGQVRYSDSLGRTFSLPSYWARFETEKRTPVDVRLHLRSRERRFEFGASLSLEERLAIGPVIAQALTSAKGI